jgi:beta-glucosidase
VDLEAGRPVDLVVDYARLETGLAGVRVGFRTVDDDALLGRALEAASSADAALVFVGTTAEWETEGHDRSAFELPGRQDELIRKVAAANPRTVVVVNAGAPVDLSWAEEVSAVLQCWFGGQEMSAAVTDVLLGVAEPGGRLPTSIPKELRHNPAHDNFPGENGELRYGEGLFMGYRGYEHRGISPRFAFGHGLSYTTLEFGEPTMSRPTFSPGERLTVSLPVINTGPRAGSEVVQCYVEPVSPRLARPLKELRAFTKVRLEPGESVVAELTLDDRSFAYWDPGQTDWDEIRARGFDMFGGSNSPERRLAGWQLDPGEYRIHVGRSSADIAFTCPLQVLGNETPRVPD